MNMLVDSKNICIICMEEGDKMKKICNTCTNTYAHDLCIEKMIDKNINQCPTCRKELFVSNSYYIITIHDSYIQDNPIIPDDNDRKKSLFDFVIFYFYVLIMICMIYYLVGILGFFIKLFIFNEDDMNISPFNIEFITQFLIGSVTILFIYIICPFCKKNNI